MASSAARSPTRRPAAGPTSGVLLAKRRIGDDAAGFTALLHLLADAGDSPEPPIPVAIETGRVRVGFQTTAMASDELFQAEPAAGTPDEHDPGRRPDSLGQATFQ